MTCKILLAVAPTQDIDNRYDEVFRFASVVKAELTIFSVIDELSREDHRVLGVSGNLALLNHTVQVISEKFLKVRDTIQQQYPDIVIKTEVVFGKALLKIVEYSRRLNFDFIVVDANRGNKKYATQLGSTTRHLMRKSAIALWVLSREQSADSMKTVIAAVDFFDRGEESERFNKKILDTAIRIGKAADARVVIFHAWRLYGKSYLEHWQRESSMNIAILEKKEYDERSELCQWLLDSRRDDYDDLDIALMEGRPQYALATYLENISDRSLLVMGTVCRTGISGLLIGNTAESILDLVDCSTVTVKPDEFLSPLLQGS